MFLSQVPEGFWVSPNRLSPHALSLDGISENEISNKKYLIQF